MVDLHTAVEEHEFEIAVADRDLVARMHEREDFKGCWLKTLRFSCREPLMPFKLHSKGRRHIPRQRHRVTNWREYDVCLRNRGSLTIWFTPDAIAGWKVPTSNNARRPASLFEPCHRNRADFANGVSIGASPERRVDWLDHANAGDRAARS